jgi:hypothetical protein
MERGEIKLDVPIIDRWEGCVRFTCQWSQQGRVEWRGPMYSGHQCQEVREPPGRIAIAAKLMDFLKAAHDGYAWRHSVPSRHIHAGIGADHERKPCGVRRGRPRPGDGTDRIPTRIGQGFSIGHWGRQAITFIQR